MFERSDFERLAEQLGSIDGRFVMSINDTPPIREIFDRFAISEVETTYSLPTGSAKGAKRAGELIITSR